MSFKVEMVWSVDASRYALLTIPSGITMADFEELESAIQIQLRGVRRALEAEVVADESHPESAVPAEASISTAPGGAEGEG